MGQLLSIFRPSSKDNKHVFAVINEEKQVTAITTTTTPATTEIISHFQQTETYDVAETVLASERDFHTNQNSTYWLPKDDEEQHRLTGVSKLLIIL
jgi:hypothetical protein